MSDTFSERLKNITNQRLEKSDTSGEAIKEFISSSLADFLDITRNTLKEDLREEMVNREILLMKKLEDQALYRLGRMDQENEHLKGEKETLLKELEKKTDPEKEFKKTIEEKNEIIYKLEEEKKILEKEKKQMEEKLRKIQLPWWKKIFI